VRASSLKNLLLLELLPKEGYAAVVRLEHGH
jgi:hypothetical protein